MFAVSETPLDLKFRALGIPVRVHPLFWLVAGMLGWQDQNLPGVILWIACVFVSILVHEFGHGLAARALGDSPQILLWGMGGLCFSGQKERKPGERLFVILAGPGAGFLLALLVMVLTTVFRGVTPAEHAGVVAGMLGFGSLSPVIAGKLNSPLVAVIYSYMIWINVMWGLLNLMPIWPLDGGQATEIVLTQFNRRHGRRRTHIVSLLVSGSLAVLAILQVSQSNGSLFNALFFGWFALSNYQMLQALHDQHLLGFEPDDDWWRR
jgi:stage IV sporulation protein FB